MKALLMHPDRDFDLGQPLAWNAPALAQDLGLDVILQAMARGDVFLLEVARRAILGQTRNDLVTLAHRQTILEDCLRNARLVRELYELAVAALEAERRSHMYGFLIKSPSSVLGNSVEQLGGDVRFLQRLRNLTRDHASGLRSPGWRRLCATLEGELTDTYLEEVRAHLKELRFRHGVLASAELGPGNEGSRYVLRRELKVARGWLERAWTVMRDLLPGGGPAHVVKLAERDEAGARALSELRDRGLASVANAIGQAAEHVQSFFEMLRTELAFYVGCLNLHDALAARGVAVCFPEASEPGTHRLSFAGLRDAALALSMERPVVENGLELDGKDLVVITGANQGGKSTFLRGVGQAQVLMQAGMFVPARSFSGEVCTALLTHYRREEDASMRSGKLDEELVRLSEIVDHLASGSMVLFNESFAATNERESAEIASQVVRALVEKGVKVLFVTHTFRFAHELWAGGRQDAAFLRAERLPDGTRTFRVVEGRPLETSFGKDLYHQVFGLAPRPTCGEGGDAPGAQLPETALNGRLPPPVA